MQKFIALGGVAPLPDAKYGTVWSRVYLASDVDARIAELEKALEKYGWHDSACDFLLDKLECTCGFEAAKPSL